MEQPLIYLDNCAFNRPYDDELSIRIKLETDAKLYIQEEIKAHRLALAWSYMLDFENAMNPFVQKAQIQSWKMFAVKTIEAQEIILVTANAIQAQGLKKKDAIHLACAKAMACQYFITTDDGLLKKRKHIQGISIVNPIEFATVWEGRI